MATQALPRVAEECWWRASAEWVYKYNDRGQPGGGEEQVRGSSGTQKLRKKGEDNHI